MLFLAAIPARRADARAEISTFRLRDKSLQANFFTSDGCYGIATYVRYAESVIQEDGPPVVTPPLTSVEVTYTNGCTGESYFLQGGTNIQNVSITGDLGSARLTATVPVSDGVQSATIQLDVTWTANAEIQQAKDQHRSFDKEARILTFERFNFKTRTADVGGVASAVLPTQDGPTLYNLAEFPQGGLLGKDLFGTRTVTFLGRGN
jgi:hypothetical protein